MHSEQVPKKTSQYVAEWIRYMIGSAPNHLDEFIHSTGQFVALLSIELSCDGAPCQFQGILYSPSNGETSSSSVAMSSTAGDSSTGESVSSSSSSSSLLFFEDAVLAAFLEGFTSSSSSKSSSSSSSLLVGFDDGLLATAFSEAEFVFARIAFYF